MDGILQTAIDDAKQRVEQSTTTTPVEELGLINISHEQDFTELLINDLKQYSAEELSILFYEKNTKGPKTSWKNTTPCSYEENLAKAQRWNYDCAVGILTGNQFLSIDCDTSNAYRQAPHHLPFGSSTACFSRDNKSGGHFVFKCSNARSTSFNDENGNRLIDVLGPGKQVVVPPSVHPKTGKPRYWLRGIDKRATVSWGDELKPAVERLAAACIIDSHWPKAGRRQEYALALAGLLIVEGGWSLHDATDYLERIMRGVTHEDEPHKRLDAVRDTYASYGQGRSDLTRGAKLASIITDTGGKGEAAVALIRRYLGIREPKAETKKESPVQTLDRKLLPLFKRIKTSNSTNL